jgi:hypothetical protein
VTRALVLAILLAGCSRVGEPCDADGDCGIDLVCHRTELPDGNAGDGVCGYARLARGEVCAVSAECADGLFCSNDLPSETAQRFGRCVELQPEGEPCFRDENCAAGLICQADGATGTCQLEAPPVDAGPDPVDGGSD